MADSDRSPKRPGATVLWVRWGVLICGVLALVWLLTLGSMWVHTTWMNYEASESAKGLSPIMISFIVLYALLIAIPFMPGIEVGVGLLMLQGAAIAPFVYLATVFGLMLAYLAGHHVPLGWLARMSCGLGLTKICDLINTIQTQSPERRLAKQRALLPRPLDTLTVEYRYVTLGVLLNLPGTFAIGGGGGILLTAGLSRLFRTWMVLLTLLVATLPVPLIVWLWGTL